MADGLYELVLGDGIADVAGLPMVAATIGFRVGVVAVRRAPTGPGLLTIRVIPESVSSRTIVLIDGDDVGPAPILNRTTSQGVAHRIEILGTSPFSGSTILIYEAVRTLTPEQRLTLEADVTPFGTIAIATIASSPGGTVFIDGEEIGPTPLANYPVTAGPVHTLEIRPFDGDAATRERYIADFRVELLEDKSLGRVELPER
jgi:hypothetical protein